METSEPTSNEFNTAPKVKFLVQGFFSKWIKIHRKLQICSHLPKKSFKETFIFCEVNYLPNMGIKQVLSNGKFLFKV